MDQTRNGSAASESEFSGVFRPPAVGRVHAPIRLAGPGKCMLAGDSVRFSGFEAKSPAGTILLGLLAMGAIIYLMAVFPGDLRVMALAGLVAMLWHSLNQGRGAYQTNRPMELSVPWKNIGDVFELDQSKSVVFIVKGFEPKGSVTFLPEGGAKVMLGAAKGRLLKV